MTNRNWSAGRAWVRGLSLIVVALLALAIGGAGNAFAKEAFTTVQRNWGTGAQPGWKLVATKAVTMSLASENLTFETLVAGTRFAWTASGLECPNCEIENRAGTGENKGKTEAAFSGQIKLTGVKMLEPSGCTMQSTLTMKPLTGVVGGGGGSNNTLRLSPTEGTTWGTWELGGQGCGFAGLYRWTGEAFGEFVNALGVDAKSQPFRLSKAIQENLGKSSSLKFGESSVFFTGEINMTAEEEFQVKEEFPVRESNSFTMPSKNPTVPRNWYTGAQPGSKLAGTQAAQMGLASEKLTFSTTAGGTAIKFTASGLECPNCKIENRAGTGENKSNTEAVLSGEFSLGGLSVVSPASCSMASMLKTKSMTGIIGGEKGSSTKAALRLSPTTGETWALIEITGENCPVSGLYKITGSEFGEFANPLGVDAKSQQFRLSPPIQEVLGTSTSLKFGENALHVSGEANLLSGLEVQVKEK